MNQWKLLITRETVLLERYFRVEGYRDMLGVFSKVKVSNLLVINNDRLTSQYVDVVETKKRFDLIWFEYKRNYLKKLLPVWKDILKNLKESTRVTLLYSDLDNFKLFIKQYQLARAVVFYTNDLSKLLESKKLSKQAKSISKWHEKAEIESSAAWDALLPFFERFCKKFEISLNELMFYLPNEFFNLFWTGKKVEEQVLKKREKYYVLLLHNRRVKFYVDKKAHQIETEQLSQATKLTAKGRKGVKGMVACRGKVVGKVRIVNTQLQMEQMKKSEILVSIMTTPRLLSAIKKASAVVTDEGGITCHAAIVSREMKKPCIIGTKIATKVFKDGDIVEVDAENGIVRFL